jgi:hypothetical protein
VLYLGLAVGFEHRAVGHLSTVCACVHEADPTQYMWGLVWFPHAILHGLNPFDTQAIWAGSGGFHLGAVTFTPAEALIAWPITAAFGPVASYNILTILAPAAGAWFAYRLCHHLTGRVGPSILGGYLFGFSSYEIGQLAEHLNLDVTFAIPALVLVALQHVDGRITGRRFVGLTAVLLTFQLLTSTEVLFTFTCLAAVSLAAAWWLAGPPARDRIIGLLPRVLAAYAITGVICSPYLYDATRQAARIGAVIPADALNLLIPTRITALAGSSLVGVSRTFPGGLVEAGMYLGLPLVAIVVIAALQQWRRPIVRVLILLLGICLLWALGNHLVLAGHRVIGLPYTVLSGLPGFDVTTTVRIGLYISLLAALLAALWLATPTRHPRFRLALAAAAVLFLLPNASAKGRHQREALFSARLQPPSFFTTSVYRHYLRPDEVVLPLPWGLAGPSLLWQAETQDYFRLASGYPYYPFRQYPVAIVAQLENSGTPPGTPPPRAPPPQTAARLRSLLVSLHVAHVVADPRSTSPAFLRILSSLGLQPQRVGGVLLYAVPADWRPVDSST